MIYQLPLTMKGSTLNIQLNQPEIERAIRQYIGQQGIDLRSKVMEIVFTSGRKENGLTASLTLADQDIPGFAAAEEVTDPVKVVVATLDAAPVKKANIEKAKAVSVAEVAVAEVIVVVAVEEPAATEVIASEPVKPTTTSLFG